jgi:hypothetical protein
MVGASKGINQDIMGSSILLYPAGFQSQRINFFWFSLLTDVIKVNNNQSIQKMHIGE